MRQALARRLPHRAAHAFHLEGYVRKITLAVAFAAAAVTLGACKKTGEGEYQVKTPEVNVTTDSTTIHTPSVEVTKDTVNMTVPKVEVKKDTAKVVVPKVKVKP